MDALNNTLIWILEICGTAVIIGGAFFWLKTAFKGQSTARSFMALVFTIIFFVVLLLRGGDFEPQTVLWLIVVYGAVLAFYIIARMVEHKEEIRAGKAK